MHRIEIKQDVQTTASAKAAHDERKTGTSERLAARRPGFYVGRGRAGDFLDGRTGAATINQRREG
jgi:hypothetical protein